MPGYLRRSTRRVEDKFLAKSLLSKPKNQKVQGIDPGRVIDAVILESIILYEGESYQTIAKSLNGHAARFLVDFSLKENEESATARVLKVINDSKELPITATVLTNTKATRFTGEYRTNKNQFLVGEFLSAFSFGILRSSRDVEKTDYGIQNA